ncbi:hypothetical protein K435DRAFT_795782 [Dendrothele bispora CBS 962.96]|uniref:Uncharacterized protein n=1 Tax=Dendrothele bispora (strain CBS 962.96) TaxID=1314807 RepID=A0A4S8M7K4_DENBC|nr:hypothetical protein K435DRAFT_795782 [Dendrothele bispora CBS 962.96]
MSLWKGNVSENQGFSSTQSCWPLTLSKQQELEWRRILVPGFGFINIFEPQSTYIPINLVFAKPKESVHVDFPESPTSLIAGLSGSSDASKINNSNTHVNWPGRQIMDETWFGQAGKKPRKLGLVKGGRLWKLRHSRIYGNKPLKKGMAATVIQDRCRPVYKKADQASENSEIRLGTAN